MSNLDFDLVKHTIVMTRGGSVSYGMATPTSDLDIKGIFIPPEEYTLGFYLNCETINKNEDLELFRHLLNQDSLRYVDNGLEGSVYSLVKYLFLAAKGNPNILEVLFCEEEDVIHTSEEGEILREHRGLFLTQVVRHQYVRYAMAQLEDIKRHKSYLLNPIKNKPTRSDFGLPTQPAIKKHKLGLIEAAIKKQTDRGYTRDQALKILVTYPEYEKDLSTPNFIANLNGEAAYTSAATTYTRQQLHWENRNAKRAALEAKYGFDTKHTSHVVRLLKTGHEILTQGKLTVRRPDFEELLAIRAGSWSYEEVMTWANDMVRKINYDSLDSPIPLEPDMVAINNLCVRLHKMFYKKLGF